MATYYVQPIVNGWVEIEVEADTETEARNKITKALEGMDFGVFRDVAWDLYDCDIEVTR